MHGCASHSTRGSSTTLGRGGVLGGVAQPEGGKGPAGRSWGNGPTASIAASTAEARASSLLNDSTTTLCELEWARSMTHFCKTMTIDPSSLTETILPSWPFVHKILWRASASAVRNSP